MVGRLKKIFDDVHYSVDVVRRWLVSSMRRCIASVKRSFKH